MNWAIVASLYSLIPHHCIEDTGGSGWEGGGR